jgi:O-antigen/teichoic acid export membrane protein
MVTPLFSFMGIILLPYVSECIAKKELRKADHFINRLLLLYVASSLAITAVLYLFTEFLTWLFFSPSYLITTDLSRIMILAILPQTLYLLYRNPIDAVSVIPYNTIILGLCLVVMIVTFSLASTLTQLAWAYTIVSALQGLLSWLTWLILSRKFATK